MRATEVVICCVYLHQVCGLDWMASYMDGMKHQVSEFGLQQFPEKSTDWSHDGRGFDCPDTSPSPEPPTTADRVRPGDVKIVAALGDSLTAAIGANATNVLEIPTEFRQLSWSIGGYGNLSDTITLPNILKIFNPHLVGFGKSSTVSYRPAALEDAGLNLAVTGANTLVITNIRPQCTTHLFFLLTSPSVRSPSPHLLPEQVRRLIAILKLLPEINFQEDWKVVTIFIGSNDLCDYCKDKVLFSADSFIQYMSEALDLLQAELPRCFVNVVQLFRIDRLRQVKDPRLGCILQRFFCPCVVQPKDDSLELLELLEVNRQFQERLRQLVQTSGRYDGKKDFAVVLQPFLQDIEPAVDQNGLIDFSFFSPDCFHLTVKGHEQMAKGLWNNMLQREGNKSHLRTFSEDLELLCPSQAQPYIYTKRTVNASAAPKVATSSLLLIILICSVFIAFCT
ncbi:phospholipase B1, membrane-associated-like [Dendrobates tinctorius]|uniref:phospholipase B1, membrane-associated-like n=1 Tax=Dendrobates tinctorius TaxID=92724 RepID=UPI003CC94615